MQQPEELRTLSNHLAQFDWTRGLTRNDIRAVYPDFPQQLYLLLPDSKRFSSPQEVFFAARLAPSRAEGDFLGAAPIIPARRTRRFRQRRGPGRTQNLIAFLMGLCYTPTTPTVRQHKSRLQTNSLVR